MSYVFHVSDKEDVSDPVVVHADDHHEAVKEAHREDEKAGNLLDSESDNEWYVQKEGEDRIIRYKAKTAVIACEMGNCCEAGGVGDQPAYVLLKGERMQALYFASELSVDLAEFLADGIGKGYTAKLMVKEEWMPLWDNINTRKEGK